MRSEKQAVSAGGARGMEASIALRWAAILDLALAAGIVLYWACWYLAPELVRSRQPGAADYAIYVAFEGAFPLPDGWVALAALLGAAGLWAGRAWGLLSTLLSMGGALFLALIDLSYDLQQGMFSPFGETAALDAAIVVGLLALSVTAIRLAWRNRAELR